MHYHLKSLTASVGHARDQIKLFGLEEGAGDGDEEGGGLQRRGRPSAR
uniref:Uncharacterized protein n=1 Tax=Arundo donax TaxID=35708 RepID=A0A0A9DZM4_ARUDO